MRWQFFSLKNQRCKAPFRIIIGSYYLCGKKVWNAWNSCLFDCRFEGKTCICQVGKLSRYFTPPCADIQSKLIYILLIQSQDFLASASLPRHQLCTLVFTCFIIFLHHHNLFDLPAPQPPVVELHQWTASLSDVSPLPAGCHWRPGPEAVQPGGAAAAAPASRTAVRSAVSAGRGDVLLTEPFLPTELVIFISHQICLSETTPNQLMIERWLDEGGSLFDDYWRVGLGRKVSLKR